MTDPNIVSLLLVLLDKTHKAETPERLLSIAYCSSSEVLPEIYMHAGVRHYHCVHAPSVHWMLC